MHTHEKITQYFLGELSADETERFEHECFSDKDFAESVFVVEDELIDQYVRNELSSQEREHFESSYLTTDARRTRVQMAGMLNRGMKSKTKLSAAPAGLWQRLTVGGSRWAYALAALILAAVVFGVWLIVRTPRRQAITQVNPSPSVPSPESTLVPTSRPSVVPSPSRASGPNPTQQVAIGVFTLVPGATRETNAGGQVIELSTQTEVIELRLILSGVPEPPYEIRIETVEGKRVLLRRGVKAVAINGEQALPVRAPASTFAARDYIGRVFDREGNAGASYSFRIVKRPN